MRRAVSLYDSSPRRGRYVQQVRAVRSRLPCSEVRLASPWQKGLMLKERPDLSEQDCKNLRALTFVSLDANAVGDGLHNLDLSSTPVATAPPRHVARIVGDGTIVSTESGCDSGDKVFVEIKRLVLENRRRNVGVFGPRSNTWIDSSSIDWTCPTNPRTDAKARASPRSRSQD